MLKIIIFQKLLPFAEWDIAVHQTGFMKGKATTDQIFSKHILLEKVRECGIQTQFIFIDFRGVYDSNKEWTIWSSTRNKNSSKVCMIDQINSTKKYGMYPICCHGRIWDT